MTRAQNLAAEISKLLKYGDLPFRDFVELALYHPQYGYYTQAESPVGPRGDYVTAPLLSPVFTFALGRLVDEFVRGAGDGPSTIVDIGCGDGALVQSLDRVGARCYGVDRALGRVERASGAPSGAGETPLFVRSFDEVPNDAPMIVLSNELFDALPFARLVQRGEHLHELYVTERDERLEWAEHEAPTQYEHYFAERGVELEDGQFADVSLEWEAFYADICQRVRHGMIVTFDYGYRDRDLFHRRARRYGTAASYASHQASRDLLADAGERDLTAHINFSDLIRAGERAGFSTLFFDRQARFLLALGALEHELLQPIAEDVPMSSLQGGIDLLERREEAKRLVLPHDIGHDIRVLVQVRNVAADGWSFQKKLF